MAKLKATIKEGKKYSFRRKVSQMGKKLEFNKPTFGIFIQLTDARAP